MRKLNDPTYMAFPFRVGSEGAAYARRREHVRQQIEQALFTNAGERVFRPSFGASVGRLIFEPNAVALWDATAQRLSAVLSESLLGEVDPSSLTITATGENGELRITVSYRLATISQAEQHVITLPGISAHG